MKKLLLFLPLFLVISCTEEVVLDLANNSNKLVIEGEVTDGVGPYYVRITKSRDFYNPQASVPYDATFVAISDNTGNIDTLVRESEGIYKTTSLSGVVGNTYYLTVADGATIYNASSTLNSTPSIDSIYKWTFFSEENIAVSIIINDPANEQNYYRFFTYNNGNFPKVMYVFEDRLINGAEWSLTAGSEEDYKVGDTVDFVLLGIDKANFDYWEVVTQNQQKEDDGNGSAAPTNPTSNISGGEVLGYFSAHTRQSKKIVIQ